MAVDLEYYRRCRDGDPTYYPADAIIHYLSTHIGEADDLANQICDDNGDQRLLTYDDCLDIIDRMRPDDAFRAGQTSDALMRGHFHIFDGDRFRLIPNPWAYMKDIIYFAADDIVRGKYEISEDLRAVIDVVAKGDFGTCNARPKAGTKAKQVKKASNSAKARKPAKATQGRRRP